MAGFIIGFDGEKSGSGERIVQFAEQTAIPTTMFGMLQVLPNTALWHRLEKKGVCGVRWQHQPNDFDEFYPTRPLEHCREYINAWELYDAERFLDRTYRCFLMLGARCKTPLKCLTWIYERC